MACISELGQRLVDHLHKYCPAFVSGFLPGVSREFVQLSLSATNLTLPEDFYELYEWHNGTLDYFTHPIGSAEICEFNPIETIREAQAYSWDENAPPSYKQEKLLPFLTKQPNFFSIVLERNYEEEAHVVEVGESSNHGVLRYDCITTMLQSTVECFDVNAFYLGEDGYLAENPSLVAEVLRTRNPNTVAEAISDLQTGLSVYGLNDQLTESEYGLILIPVLSSLETLRVLRPSEAIELVKEHTIQLKEKKSYRALSAQEYLHEWLNEVT
jgi:hypothetical protein